MIYKLSKSITSNKLAEQIGAEHYGLSKNIIAFSDSQSAKESCLCFIDDNSRKHNQNSIVISNFKTKDCISNIICSNPRLAFIEALSYFHANGYIAQQFSGKIHKTADVASSAIIEEGAELNAGVHVGPGSYIRACVVLGANSKVGANSVLGHDGFGFEKNSQGVPVRFPHFGRLVVGKDCEIGNSCSISRGTLNDTIVKNGVKIDDNAYLAHNVLVKENSYIMSGVRLNGSVEVGKDCWIGTNAMVREGCIVSNNTTVGMGSVVVKNIPSSAVVFGNPAK